MHAGMEACNIQLESAELAICKSSSSKRDFLSEIVEGNGIICGRSVGSDGGTILKVGGPKVYPVFSPRAHNAQLYAYSDFRCFSTSYCKYSMSLKVTGTTQFVLKSAPMNVIPSRN